MRPRSFWVCDKEFCVLSLLKNRTGVLWVLNIVAQQLMNISHPWCLEKIVRTLLSFIQVPFCVTSALSYTSQTNQLGTKIEMNGTSQQSARLRLQKGVSPSKQWLRVSVQLMRWEQRCLGHLNY